MRHTMLVLGAAVCLFAPGCQEHSAIDPLTSVPASAMSTAKPTPRVRIIPLSGRLDNPGMGSPFFEINGELIISVEEIPGDCAWTHYAIGIQAHGELIPFKRRESTSTLYGNSSDQVLFEVGAELEKNFPVQNRKDGLSLHVRLLVTREVIELEGLWLELSEMNARGGS